MRTSLPVVRSADHEPEQDIYRTRHAVVLGGTITAATSGLISLIAWGWFTITGHEGWSSLMLLVAVGLVGLAVISLLRSYLRNRGVGILVTNQALTRRRRRLFWRQEKTVILEAVKVMKVNQGLFGGLLNYGTVWIAHDEGRTVLRNIIDPRRLVREIKAHQKHEHGLPHLVKC
ncbi:MAG: hypothetical protein AB7Q01_07315 [Gammaproteobacteria bacterium]